MDKKEEWLNICQATGPFTPEELLMLKKAEKLGQSQDCNLVDGSTFSTAFISEYFQNLSETMPESTFSGIRPKGQTTLAP